MLISVVVCGYTMERHEVLADCVESVLAQTYEPLEIVIVVDGNDESAAIVEQQFGERKNVVIEENGTNRGISYSRTRGGEVCEWRDCGFIDDEGIAEPDWIETDEKTEAVAVGAMWRGTGVEASHRF